MKNQGNISDDTVHKEINKNVIDLIESEPGIKLVFNLEKALASRGLTQRKLSFLTGLRTASISELCNGKKTSINKQHLLAVMIALRITDLREIVDVQFDTETYNKFVTQADEWKKTNNIPLDVKDQAYKIFNDELNSK